METSDGSSTTRWLGSQSRDAAAFACQRAETDQWLAVLVGKAGQGRWSAGQDAEQSPTGVTDVAPGPGVAYSRMGRMNVI